MDAELADRLLKLEEQVHSGKLPIITGLLRAYQEGKGEDTVVATTATTPGEIEIILVSQRQEPQPQPEPEPLSWKDLQDLSPERWAEIKDAAEGERGVGRLFCKKDGPDIAIRCPYCHNTNYYRMESDTPKVLYCPPDEGEGCGSYFVAYVSDFTAKVQTAPVALQFPWE